jgi:two-component system CheB/CheR fusion protein
VVVIRDTSERGLRLLQEQFIALASHELKTPLTALLLFQELHLAELRNSNPNQPFHHADLVTEQAERLQNLVNELLDVSRLRHDKLQLRREPTDLIPLARRVVEAGQAVARGQTLHLVVAEPALVVDGDAGRLEDLLLNLLTNAIKYAAHTERIEVRIGRADGEAMIEVQDYGAGIPSTELANIFSRFYQVSRNESPADAGLGLGLFFAEQVAIAHGGRIDVQSEVGRGTTFTVLLPLIASGNSVESPTAAVI